MWLPTVTTDKELVCTNVELPDCEARCAVPENDLLIDSDSIFVGVRGNVLELVPFNVRVRESWSDGDGSSKAVRVSSGRELDTDSVLWSESV